MATKTTEAPRLTAAVSAWLERQETPGLGLAEALTALAQDWAAGPPPSPAEHVRRMEALTELSDALRAATIQVALEAVDAGLSTKEVASALASTGATVSKWIKEARTAA